MWPVSNTPELDQRPGILRASQGDQITAASPAHQVRLPGLQARKLAFGTAGTPSHGAHPALGQGKQFKDQAAFLIGVAMQDIGLHSSRRTHPSFLS